MLFDDSSCKGEKAAAGEVLSLDVDDSVVADDGEVSHVVSVACGIPTVMWVG